jgi:sugar fermentation stimulation protein A
MSDPLVLFDRTLRARYLSRPNRFLIRCEYRGRPVQAFLPNPGRLHELLLPECIVHLTRDAGHGIRKNEYTAVAVERDGHIMMLHTHRTNDVARYLLMHGKIPGLEDARILQHEIPMGRSRFDFLLETGAGRRILEVKSCTLVGERVAMFPDAVTARGTRHLQELAGLSREGKEPVVLFIVHWPFVRFFMPDYHTDLVFSRTLLLVREKIQVLPIAVSWGQDLSLSPEGTLLHIPWDDIDREARDRGSYLLILNLPRRLDITVGSLGRVRFRKGFYIYVGSAMANLTRRMERHRRVRKKLYWHIDYLRTVAQFHSILAIRSSDRLECDIARAVSEISEWSIQRFGSSDCGCGTHLFGMATDPLQSYPFHKMLQYFRMDRFGDGGR